jgi:N-methylhydantoinase B
VPNRAALTIMTRNSRMPESLAGDLDAECSACLMGTRRVSELFERYGVETVEACFDAIIDDNTETYRREILPKIPDGTYVWEDYAEHDGVDDPKLHRQRITLTKVPETDPGGARLILDFTGTSPQAKGPINHVANRSDGNFLKKWLAPILRNLADTPERMAELDVNEGIVPLIEMRFPEEATLLTPRFPAPTNARTFVILRLLGVLSGCWRRRRRAHARRPGDDPLHRGLRRGRADGEQLPDARGARRRFRRPVLRRRRGHHPRRPRLAQPAVGVHREPLPPPGRVARPGADSGGARRAAGGLGYDKQIRMLVDAYGSCPSRTVRSWRAGASRAARPVPRSGSRSTRVARTSVRWRASSTTSP